MKYTVHYIFNPFVAESKNLTMQEILTLITNARLKYIRHLYSNSKEEDRKNKAKPICMQKGKLKCYLNNSNMLAFGKSSRIMHHASYSMTGNMLHACHVPCFSSPQTTPLILQALCLQNPDVASEYFSP